MWDKFGAPEPRFVLCLAVHNLLSSVWLALWLGVLAAAALRLTVTGCLLAAPGILSFSP